MRISEVRRYAREAGYQVRHGMLGYYVCTNEEGEHEDAGNPSVGFDGRAHFVSTRSGEHSAWRYAQWLAQRELA